VLQFFAIKHYSPSQNIAFKCKDFLKELLFNSQHFQNHALQTIFFYFMPPQTMSTYRIQLHSLKLLEKLEAESTITYLQFVKMAEHALTQTRASPKSAGLTLQGTESIKR